MNLENKKYKRRSGWLPYAEIGVGCYFMGMVVFAFETFNFFAVPFLLLFVLGYWYTGLLSLLQGRFERAGTSGQEMHEKPYPVGI